MNITRQNTEFFTFFTGVRNRELLTLEKLADTFREHIGGQVNVLDQCKPVHQMIERGERIYYTERCVMANINPDLDKGCLEKFYQDNEDVVNRIEVPEQHTHGQLINLALTKYGSKPYTVILDSDVWFKNSDLMPDLAMLAEPYEAEDLAAIGHLIQGVPFSLPSTHYSDERKTRLYQLGEYFMKRFGGDWFNLPRAKLPRLDPALLWINRDLFVRCGMHFKNAHLDIIDTTHGAKRHFKALGDNGSSFFFQCAYYDKTVINVDIRKWCVHVKNVGHARKPEEVRTDWFNPRVKWEPGMWKDSPHRLNVLSNGDT